MKKNVTLHDSEAKYGMVVMMLRGRESHARWRAPHCGGCKALDLVAYHLNASVVRGVQLQDTRPHIFRTVPPSTPPSPSCLVWLAHPLPQQEQKENCTHPKSCLQAARIVDVLPVPGGP